MIEFQRYIHNMSIHFPIALLFTVPLLDCLSVNLLVQRASLRAICNFNYLLGMISMVVSIVAGFITAHGARYFIFDEAWVQSDPKFSTFVISHMQFAFIVLGYWLILSLFRYKSGVFKTGASRYSHCLLSLFGVGLLAYQGHLGAYVVRF